MPDILLTNRAEGHQKRTTGRSSLNYHTSSRFLQSRDARSFRSQGLAGNLAWFVGLSQKLCKNSGYYYEKKRLKVYLWGRILQYKKSEVAQ